MTGSGKGAARTFADIRRLVPGLLVSSLVAVAAVGTAPYIAGIVPIPAMVIALLIGVTLNPLARQPLFQPGIVFCLKTILRCAVALLGLRIALGDIAALGWSTAGSDRQIRRRQIQPRRASRPTFPARGYRGE